MTGRALLLDKNYMALSIINWKKAVKLMVKGKAEPVDMNEAKAIKTNDSVFTVPTILRLLVVIPWRAHMGRLRFSRKNLMIRDNWECQYCGIHLGKSSGTIDHVVPRSRGGKTDYLNCVACCKTCNEIKGDKKLEYSGLTLRAKPKKPGFVTLYKHLLNEPPEGWSDYIIGLT
jgi:5-methylcytosine-specific restriction endonuclease McrA